MHVSCESSNISYSEILLINIATITTLCFKQVWSIATTDQTDSSKYGSSAIQGQDPWHRLLWESL